jgi:uncharacterized protein YcaQ
MPPRRSLLEVDLELVRRLWLQRQGLLEPRGAKSLSKRSFSQHLENVGALQIDPLNVLERAHYLTLWSRFGAYDKRKVDRFLYRDRVGYEYWGHEASVLPISHLPLGRRRMRLFPGPWRTTSWWPRFETSQASRRRVLRRIREDGPLGSGDFEARPEEFGAAGPPGGAMPMPKEDGRSLKLLWHSGRLAISSRTNGRLVYDLAERIYPAGEPATPREYEDSWLFIGLAGNGVASEKHLTGYFTAPALKAPDRKRVIARNLAAGTIVEVRVAGQPGRYYARPEDLEGADRLPEPEGTTLLCPFDSLLWQRGRAEDLFGFEYRVEIYVPAAKRRFGYYVLPILHQGRLVGRLDPKTNRDEGVLEVKSLHFEPDFKKTKLFRAALRESLEDLALLVGAERGLRCPRF